MELNAEINKVFGQEMAKLFATQISEDEMHRAAGQAWSMLNREEWINGKHTTALKDLTMVAIKNNLAEEIKNITNSEEFKDECKKLAEEIVKDIREETYKKVVEEVSNRLAGMSLGYQGIGLAGLIEETVVNMMHR